MTLITPTWQADPPNSGTVQIVVGTPFVPTGWPTGYAEWQDFTYTASPANGYQFDHFEITINTRYTHSAGDPEDHTDTYTTHVNPYESSSSSFVNGSAWWYDYGYTPGLEGETAQVTAIDCKAVFVRAHAPTHLPVYDDRPNGTGLLVHDPTTNLLVADY